MKNKLWLKKLSLIASLLCLLLLVGCSEESGQDSSYDDDDDYAVHYYDDDYDYEGYYNGEDYENDIGHPTDHDDEYIEEAYFDDDFFYYETPDSTAFAEIGYSFSQEILYVSFRNSGNYHYYDVPQDLFNDFLHAYSKGKFYNAYIKGQYESERI